MRSFTLTSVLILACTALLGCGERGKGADSSLKAHYDEIKGGMTLREVRSLLGPGRRLVKSDGIELHIPGLDEGAPLVWQDGQTSITVVFIDDRVAAKSRAVAPAKRE